MDQSSSATHVSRIVSGGQTGVDRGALDAAMALEISHGGWCPRGRLAEDGRIPDRYQLSETDSAEYWVRTEQNVIDSDGTLILYRGKLSGGTQLTYQMTRKHGRPCLLVDLMEILDPDRGCHWITTNGVRVLNVAGPRESSAAGISRDAQVFVETMFER